MVTTTNDFGLGTLRSAILAANGSSGDTIELSNSVTGFLVLQSALPPLTSNMTISGPGVSVLAITGGQIYQCPQIGATATVTISGLTIENCTAGQGGAISITIGGT